MFHKTEFKVAKTSQRKVAMYRENRKCVPKAYRNDEHMSIGFKSNFSAEKQNLKKQNNIQKKKKTPLKSPLQV